MSTTRARTRPASDATDPPNPPAVTPQDGSPFGEMRVERFEHQGAPAVRVLYADPDESRLEAWWAARTLAHEVLQPPMGTTTRRIPGGIEMY